MFRALAIIYLVAAAIQLSSQQAQPCSAALPFNDLARKGLDPMIAADDTTFEIALKQVCGSNHTPQTKRKMIACVYRVHFDAVAASGKKLSAAEQMLRDGSMPDMFLCATTNSPADARNKDAHPYYGFTSTEELKKQIDAIQREVSRDSIDFIDLELKMWKDSRLIAAAAYEETLDKALDAWYLNGKNWSKIPEDLWGKLTERDRGRIREGIDPELMVTPHHAQP